MPVFEEVHGPLAVKPWGARGGGGLRAAMALVTLNDEIQAQLPIHNNDPSVLPIDANWNASSENTDTIYATLSICKRTYIPDLHT